MYIGPEVLSVNGMPEQAITHYRAAVQWALHLLCNSCVASIARFASSMLVLFVLLVLLGLLVC